MIKYIDLFAGIGGFHYGLEKASKKYKCVYSNEWDKYASSIYKKHYGECDTRDITTVPSGDIPDHDLLVGGFPCQSFSIAGKRKGFDDTRGTLFFEIARILSDKRPRYFILENVKGLLSHDSGKTFQTILKVLTDLGYEYQWQVLNSKNFGVPQNRERVFIIGHLRGERRPKIFPVREDDGFPTQRQGQVSPTITQRYYKQGQSDPYIVTEKPEAGQQSLQQEGDKSDSSNLGGRKAHTANTRWPLKFLERNQKNIEGDYSFTVDGANTGGVKQDMKIRRLTPTECERLQGFPDGWTEGISDTQRYKCLGNAVTTNVVTWIGEKLLISL
jgi:DNA (cytosine-5)-methyltransferase 1